MFELTLLLSEMLSWYFFLSVFTFRSKDLHAAD